MPRWSPLTLDLILERMARLSPSRHRELARGMVAELDAILDPTERRRFALGAAAAIARLALRDHIATFFHTPDRMEPEVGASLGGRLMTKLTTRQLLRRHLTPFFVSVATLTAFFLVQQAARQVPQLSASGLPAEGIAEVLVLNLPNIVGLTIPMAVFITVSWVFTRLGAEGVLTSARRERHGVRRLVVPVLCVAAVIGTLTLVSNTQLLPRANARLITVIDRTPRELNDRTMTIGELREAARRARTATGTEAAARAAAYEVEIQKKFALAAACMILALVGAATAIRFPLGGVGLVIGASGFVFTGYYLSLVAGETFADRQVISPLVGMWMANGFLVAVVLLLVWRPNRSGSTGDGETLVVGG